MIKFCSQLFILLALALLTNGTAAAPMMALIDDEHPTVDISTVGGYYVDESGTLSLRDIDSDLLRKRFIPLNSSPLQFGLVKGNLWLRVDVARRLTSSQPTVLHIKAPRVQRLDVYTPTLTYNQIYKEMGEDRPFHNRPVNSPDYIIPLPANVPPVFTVYIKVSSHLPINLCVEVKTFSTLEHDLQWNTYTTGTLMGAALLLLIGGLFLFARTQHPMYLTYSLVLLCIIGFHLSFHGVIYQLVPSLTGLQERLYNVSALVCAAALAFFTRLYLDSKEQLPNIDRMLTVLSLFNLAMALLFVTTPAELNIALLTISIFTTAILLLMVAIYALYRQLAFSNRYFGAHLVLTVGYGIWILSAYGAVPLLGWYDWGLTSSLLLTMLFHFISFVARSPLLTGNPTKVEATQSNNNELLDELAARIKRQTAVISHHQKKNGKASQAALEQAQANLSHLAERLNILHQIRVGNVSQTYSSINLQTLIEQAYTNFEMLDQNEAEIELVHDNIIYWEVTANSALLNHLYQSIMEELKHYTDQVLSIKSTVELNEREGIKELRIIVSPIPSTVELHGSNRLGTRYLEDISDYLDGKVSLSGDGRNRTMLFVIPISARYVEPSELARRTHSDDLNLVIVGKDSELIERSINHLHAQLFTIAHIDQLDELYHLLHHRLPQNHFAVLLFEDWQNFGASDLASFLNELHDSDVCLLISNNVKMSQEYANALGFDGFIYSGHIESKLIPELERLLQEPQSRQLPRINRNRQRT